MKIGNINFTKGVVLAPMAGVTDVGFRSVCREFGAEICCTEMVSAKGLIYGDKKLKLDENDIFLQKNILKSDFLQKNPQFLKNKTASLLITEENETPKVVQLFGSNPEIMALACQHSLIQKFDIIDINMGCPAPKIVKNGEGSFLMTNIDLAKKIISACKQSTDKPITVKMRKGYKVENAITFARACEEAGADAITIHGRLASEGYSGKVDLEIIRQVKNAVKIPVIASGDVKDIASYLKTKATGVDGVMIGRGALGKPYIFKELLTEQEISKEEQLKLRYYCAKKHIEILRKYYKEEFLIKYMRKHLLWYASGIANKEIKQKLALSENLDEALEILKNLCLN